MGAMNMKAQKSMGSLPAIKHGNDQLTHMCSNMTKYEHIPPHYNLNTMPAHHIRRSVDVSYWDWGRATAMVTGMLMHWPLQRKNNKVLL